MTHYNRNSGQDKAGEARILQEPWRFIYWCWAQADSLRQLLKSRGHRCTFLRDLPCAAFRRDNPVIVEPAAWDKTCARQGSWYRAAQKFGALLLVSPVDLSSLKKTFKIDLAATITFSDFTPKRSATAQEIEALKYDPFFQEVVPEEWFKATENESRQHMKLAARYGSTLTSWPELFSIQTANHANFFNPKLYTIQNNQKVPYSIYSTAYICSCCLQLFRVVETGHPMLLSAPCPGGVIYGHLSPDSFLLVQNNPYFELPA